jgi:hypothetical protein
MRKVDDPGTQIALSTLMFNHDNPAHASDSDDSGDLGGAGGSVEAAGDNQDADGPLSSRAAEKRPYNSSVA